MLPNIFKYSISIIIFSILASCNHNHNEHTGHDEANHGIDMTHENNEVNLSNSQFQALELKVDTLHLRNFSDYIEVNGKLEAAPEDEAVVTATIGANISNIKVIEGDEVKKGQILAYLSHPDLIKVQTEYLNNWNKLQFLEKEFIRQKRLNEENVGSGADFQQTQANYQAMKASVRGLQAQLNALGINATNISQGEIYERIPVKSPIDGFLKQISVRNGQFVQPQTEMFGIINTDHIHALLMVFENDIHHVKEGQPVTISIESLPEIEYKTTVHVVGKTFEEDLKAVRIHADIENKDRKLLPGMYARGKILTSNKNSFAIPEEGVVREGDKLFVFSGIKKETDNDQVAWTFYPVEVITGITANGWIEVKPLIPLGKEDLIAFNRAYYLMAELKKEEAGHDH